MLVLIANSTFLNLILLSVVYSKLECNYNYLTTRKWDNANKCGGIYMVMCYDKTVVNLLC